MPVEAIFRGPRRRWREGLSCNSARKRLWRKGFEKKNCTATLTHIVSKLPCSYGSLRQFGDKAVSRVAI